MREAITRNWGALGVALVLLSAPCLAAGGDLQSGAEWRTDAKGATTAPKLTGPSAKPRDTGRPCPKLTPEQYPALLFRKPIDGGRRSDLTIVHFVKGQPRYDHLPQGRYRRIFQVDTAAFLLCTAGHNKNGEVLLADLSRGKMLSLKRGVGDLRLLRTDLKRRRAVFAAMNVREGFVDLVELDLKTFNMPSTIRLTGDKLGGDFSEIVGMLQISPDFKRLAYAARLGGKLHDTRYELRVLQIATGKTAVLDGNVKVLLPMGSSFAYGRPPVTWLDNNRVLYQHHLDALTMLKIADAGKGTVANLLEAKLSRTLRGGTLRLCPFSGKVIYHEQYTVDLAAKRLIEIANPTTQPRYQVLISPSGKHHAYVVLGGKGRFQDRTVMVKTKALAKPIAVSRAGIPGPRPIAWIEKLPAARPDSRPAGAASTPEKEPVKAPAKVALARRNAKMVRKLDTRVFKLDFEEMELSRVFQFLRDVSGANIHVKWRVLALAGVKPTYAVNVRLSRVTFRKALETVLENVPTSGKSALVYVVNEGVITISTKSDLSGP